MTGGVVSEFSLFHGQGHFSSSPQAQRVTFFWAQRPASFCCCGSTIPGAKGVCSIELTNRCPPFTCSSGFDHAVDGGAAPEGPC